MTTAFQLPVTSPEQPNHSIIRIMRGGFEALLRDWPAENVVV